MNNVWEPCPLCNGEGVVENKGYDGNTFSIDNRTCPVCKGGKLINKITGRSRSTGVTDLTPENNSFKQDTVKISPFTSPNTTLKFDFSEVKDVIEKLISEYPGKKIPIHKDCPNIGLGTCFCPGTCKEIIGYRDK